MTPTHPLTPSENAEVNAALKAACATFDAQRLNRIDDLRTIETCSMEMSALCSQAGFVTTQAEYIADASAYHLAAALLAGQMAARLAV